MPRKKKTATENVTTPSETTPTTPTTTVDTGAVIPATGIATEPPYDDGTVTMETVTIGDAKPVKPSKAPPISADKWEEIHASREFEKACEARVTAKKEELKAATGKLNDASLRVRELIDAAIYNEPTLAAEFERAENVRNVATHPTCLPPTTNTDVGADGNPDWTPSPVDPPESTDGAAVPDVADEPTVKAAGLLGEQIANRLEFVGVPADAVGGENGGKMMNAVMETVLMGDPRALNIGSIFDDPSLTPEEINGWADKADELADAVYIAAAAAGGVSLPVA